MVHVPTPVLLMQDEFKPFHLNVALIIPMTDIALVLPP